MLIVVAAAVLRGGRVLAARRSGVRDGWEFPGGKIEPGESDQHAVRREISEELGVDVAVFGRLGVSRSAGIELRLFETRLTGPAPTMSTDHDQLRWLAVDELADVTWLPLDRPLLPAVAGLLRGTALHD